MENLFCPICGSRRVSPAANGIYMCASCDNAFSFTKEVTYAKTTADIYKASVECVLEINTIAGENESSGTGIIISPHGYVLTNAHITGEAMTGVGNMKNYCDVIIAGRRPREILFRAELIYSDKAADLALLYCAEAEEMPALKILYSTVKTGDKICVIGNGKGEGLGIVDGIVSDTCREIGGRKLMMISAPVTTGYSGGPVLSADGEFIGMVTGGRDGETAMNYAIPSVTIRKFLASAEKKAGIRL